MNDASTALIPMPDEDQAVALHAAAAEGQDVDEDGDTESAGQRRHRDHGVGAVEDDDGEHRSERRAVGEADDVRAAERVARDALVDRATGAEGRPGEHRGQSPAAAAACRR